MPTTDFSKNKADFFLIYFTQKTLFNAYFFIPLQPNKSNKTENFPTSKTKEVI